jgi:hypothetical protein
MLERAAGPSPRDGSVLRYAQHVIIPGPARGKLFGSEPNNANELADRTGL